MLLDFDECGYNSMTGVIKGMTSVDIGKELLEKIIEAVREFFEKLFG